MSNPVSDSYTYKTNSNGTTTTLVYSHTDMLGIKHTYAYDGNGNIQAERIENGSAVEYKSYLYDSLNRLTRYNDSEQNLTVLYEYDARGNILKATTYEYSAYTNPVNTKLSEKVYAYGDSTWADLLTNIDGTAISYDNAGNPLNWTNGRTLTWENGRRLVSIGATSFNYNSDGLRTYKTTTDGKTTEYYILNGTYVGEKTTINGTEYIISYVYDENGAPAGLNVNGSAFFFAKNVQGDVTAVFDYTGSVIAKYTYDAYGKITSITNASGVAITSETSIANLNPFRYRGYMYDTETGLYYLNSRYYDPAVGRFLNADSVVGNINSNLNGYNLFSYCFNNPIMYVDFGGAWPDVNLLIKGTLAFAIGTLAVAAVVATGGACTPLVALGYSVLATSGTIMMVTGASEIEESFTGQNAIKDEIGQEGFDSLQAGATFVISFGTDIISMGNNSVCFVAGTLIASDDGNIPIEAITVGMLVYATDPNTGETELKPVIQTFVKETNEVLHLIINEEIITTTPEHPFWVVQKGWIEAAKLSAGDMLQLLNGQYVILESVQHEILDAPITVYNFEVEDFHTYYVTDQQILVHNSCGSNGSYEKASYHNKGNSLKSAAPIDGQAALDKSFSLGPNTNRRIGISQGQFVVLDQTSDGVFHGHVRTWDQLTVHMKNILLQNRVVNRKGKILGN